MEFFILLISSLSVPFSANSAPLPTPPPLGAPLPTPSPLGEHGLSFSGSGEENLQAITGAVPFEPEAGQSSGDHINLEVEISFEVGK